MRALSLLDAKRPETLRRPHVEFVVNNGRSGVDGFAERIPRQRGGVEHGRVLRGLRPARGRQLVAQARGAREDLVKSPRLRG